MPSNRRLRRAAGGAASAGAAGLRSAAKGAANLGAAAERLLDRDGRRRLHRLAREPLPNLFDEHPEARFAARRELGLVTIPVSRIRGTAVEGPTQRGGDFRPLPFLRGANWRSRWQRLKAAADGLVILPPIDVIETADGYWVVDGHNRVALALYNGQADIDASVTHLHLPGEAGAAAPTGSLESVLADSEALRSVTRRPPER